jgi:monothiol glutaredoxin
MCPAQSLPARFFAAAPCFTGFAFYGAATEKNMSANQQPQIIAWLKPTCGWSNGVRATFKKYQLAYEDRDIINDPAHRADMIARSGQSLSPCVEVNGQILADVSGAEVEAWLVQNGYIQRSDAPTEVPNNSACQNHGGTVPF